jgi:hypothetical protein
LARYVFGSPTLASSSLMSVHLYQYHQSSLAFYPVFRSFPRCLFIPFNRFCHLLFTSPIHPSPGQRRVLPFFSLSLRVTCGVRIVQSNDDGWAEINLRTFFDVLNAAGHQVILSGPADNQSGIGSSDREPKVVGEKGCEFDSCAPGSPAVGANASDNRLNYVNSYP